MFPLYMNQSSETSCMCIANSPVKASRPGVVCATPFKTCSLYRDSTLVPLSAPMTHRNPGTQSASLALTCDRSQWQRRRRPPRRWLTPHHRRRPTSSGAVAACDQLVAAWGMGGGGGAGADSGRHPTPPRAGRGEASRVKLTTERAPCKLHYFFSALQPEQFISR